MAREETYLASRAERDLHHFLDYLRVNILCVDLPPEYLAILFYLTLCPGYEGYLIRYRVAQDTSSTYNSPLHSP